MELYQPVLAFIGTSGLSESGWRTSITACSQWSMKDFVFLMQQWGILFCSK